MQRRPVRIITTPPIVVPITRIQLDPEGVAEMARWVHENRPECLPDDLFTCEDCGSNFPPEDIMMSLFPHEGMEPDIFGGQGGPYREVTGAELLPELAGRKCYDSFGIMAGRKTNADYLRHVMSMDPPHASILYHTHLTFFIGDTSRRLSQEMFRNYVGSHANHEGAPSQESTRYTVHHGAYVAHPWDIENDKAGMHAGLETYQRDCEILYEMFCAYVENEREQWHNRNGGYGQSNTGLGPVPCRKMPPDVHKAILGSAAQRHGWGFATSYIWTSNPIALAKLFKERDHAAADPEFQRLAHTWKRVCVMRWPNLFPQYIEEILKELEAERAIAV